jgi:hypothetical protein
MNAVGFSILLHFLILAGFVQGMAFQKESEPVQFQWLSGSGETVGVKYKTNTLTPLALPTDNAAAAVEVEQEVVKVDDQTTRTIRRAFDNSVNGERRLIESVVEEIQKMSNGSMRAVRTISRKDGSGSLSPIQRDIQELTPAGTNKFQIKRSLLQPGLNGTFVEKEQIIQNEALKQDKIVEIDRIRYMPDSNGKWNAIDRRLSKNNLGDQIRTGEEVYRYDVNSKPMLTQQNKVTEWADAAGQRHRKSESYVPNLQGELELSGRRTILQKALPNGNQQTTEVLEMKSPSAPGEGLRLVQKVVENVKLRNNEKERQIEVLEPDANGRLTTVRTWLSLEEK